MSLSIPLSSVPHVMKANMQKCTFLKSYTFPWLEAQLSLSLISNRQIQNYYCCVLMHYFRTDVTVAWLELSFYGHPFLGVLQWAILKENPWSDSGDSMDKTASGLVSSISHIFWRYASRLCTLNSLVLQGMWHIPSVLCHTSTTLVGCSLTLKLFQMHWNGTSSSFLPKNQVSMCRATWAQRNPRAK